MILGEMRGQLREVVHGLNNLSGKFDGLSREVIGLGVLAKDVIELKSRQEQDVNALRVEITTLKAEIGVLKTDRDKRAGAVSLVEWVVRHWPGVLGFLLLVALVLRTSGRISL
jgi:hypothetical protein